MEGEERSPRREKKAETLKLGSQLTQGGARGDSSMNSTVKKRAAKAGNGKRKPTVIQGQIPKAERGLQRGGRALVRPVSGREEGNLSVSRPGVRKKRKRRKNSPSQYFSQDYNKRIWEKAKGDGAREKKRGDGSEAKRKA